MSKRKEADKPAYTVAEINGFLDRRVGRKNHVRGAVENVWLIPDADHVGEGRGFHVVTCDGT